MFYLLFYVNLYVTFVCKRYFSYLLIKVCLSLFVSMLCYLTNLFLYFFLYLYVLVIFYRLAPMHIGIAYSWYVLSGIKVFLFCLRERTKAPSFGQPLHKREEEVQILPRWFQRERIDGEFRLLSAHL